MGTKMGKTTFYQTSNEHYNLVIKSSNGLVCVLSFEHPILGFKEMNIEHHASNRHEHHFSNIEQV